MKSMLLSIFRNEAFGRGFLFARKDCRFAGNVAFLSSFISSFEKSECSEMQNKKFFGFSIVELLLAVSIVLILAGIVFVSYRNFSSNQVLSQTASFLREDLRSAQQQTLAGEKPQECDIFLGYKVIFDSDNKGYQVLAECQSGQGPFAELTSKSEKFPVGIRKNSGPNWVLFQTLEQGFSTDWENREGSSSSTIEIISDSTKQTATISISVSGEIK